MSQIKQQTLLISIALIIVLGFITYGNSVNGEFILDDGRLIKENPYLTDRCNVFKVFRPDIAAGPGTDFSFYRPIQMFSYRIDYAFWKLNVRGYHLTNIILHILVALSLFWLINLLYQNWLLSLLTSLLFLIHPIHTEAVSYISGRADCLAAFFMLLCIIFYIKRLATDRVTFYILMLVSYILALLSRENSLILPAILLLYHYNFKKRFKAKMFLPILILAFAYIILRVTLLSSLLSRVVHSTTLGQRLPGFFVALTSYLRSILLPFNLHMEYGKKLFALTSPPAILGLLILVALLIYIFQQRKTRSLAFFSISWFLIMLLPSANLYPINAYMAEHWLYLPSIGYFLILASALNYLYKIKQAKISAAVLIIILLTFYTALTIRQNNYWRQPIAFYERTLKYGPDNPGIYNNLGNTYRQLGESEQAIEAYQKAIQLDPNLPGAYYNLGNTYRDLGQSQEAIAAYQKAIQLKPDYAEVYNSLGIIYAIKGSYNKAAALFAQAIQLRPDSINVQNNLSKAYYNLALNYFQQQQYKLAIEYCDKAGELGFDNSAIVEALKPYRDDN